MIFPKPVAVTGALQDQDFTLPAPGVLAGATVAPGFDVAVLNYSQPQSGCGTVTVSPDGALALVPAPRFAGNCSFAFYALDDQGALVTATAVVNVGESSGAWAVSGKLEPAGAAQRAGQRPSAGMPAAEPSAHTLCPAPA